MSDVQNDMIERRNRCLPSLDKTSDVRFSQFFSYFVAVGLVYS